MTIIYALNVTVRRLHIFSSEADVKKTCEGLSIAEGDWLFFSEDGFPLEAQFSIPAKINFENNTYSNGNYSLRPKTGQKLETMFPYVEFAHGHAIFKDIIYDQELEKFLATKS